MLLNHKENYGHLTYCTNIHAGETWNDIFDGIKKNLPAIKASQSPNAPFGLGLRLSALAAETLRDPKIFADFEQFLKDGGYYIFTLNGFPYGNFHGKPVKEGAYRPDWQEEARLQYTNLMADHLARWLPEEMEGSISTVPGTYKAWAEGPDHDKIAASIADNIIRHVAHLVGIRKATGKLINLALEPEPSCMIETMDETIAFYENYIFSESAAGRLASLTELNQAEALTALREHVGVCYDVCHAAVEFEDARQSLAKLKNANIKISKLQLSSAMRIPVVNAETKQLLGAMNEPTYMHQVIQNHNGTITRFTDIPFALEKVEEAKGAEWRIHFHVPIFLNEMQSLGTTQQFLMEVLAIHAESPVTNQLEVETYTWDVLPDKYRASGMSAAISRELAWVRDQLAK